MKIFLAFCLSLCDVAKHISLYCSRNVTFIVCLFHVLPLGVEQCRLYEGFIHQLSRETAAQLSF